MNKPLRISLLSRHITSRGGLEKWTMRIASEFAKKGGDITILTSDMLTKNSPYSIETLPLNKWSSHGKMKQFDHLCSKWNKTHSPDIIFAMDRTSHQTHLRAGNGVHAAYLAKRKIFENVSPLKLAFNPIHKTILKLEKQAFENPLLKVLFTNSYMVKEEILHYYSTSPEKIKVIHNGVAWKALEKDFVSWIEQKHKNSEELGIDNTKYHFLFVGNGYERKGLTLLLHALKILTPRDFHLSVIGKDRDIKKFMNLAHSLDLSNHVSFYGHQENIFPFYQMADSLIIPSIYDPFANVTVEALAMGLFVVSSKTNGGHEILKGETGTVIEDLKSAESLRDSLAVAMAHPKTWIRSQMIRKSVEHLDLSNQLTSLIENVLENQ